MFAFRIQEHLNQVTQDLWPSLLWVDCCQSSNCLTKTDHFMSKWPEKIKVLLLGLYLGSEFGKRTNSGAKGQNTQSQIFGLDFFKISLNPLPPLSQFLSARCGCAVPGSQQSRTEGEFGKKLTKSCKNVIWSDLEFCTTVISKGKRHSLCMFCEHSRPQKCTMC